MSKTTFRALIILATVLITEVIAEENSFCQPYGYHTGADAVKDYTINELINRQQSDAFQFCQRLVKWRSHSRFYSLQKPIVHDALAEDIDTKLSVVVKGYSSTKEAVDASLHALFDLLRKHHEIEDACTVPDYSPSAMVNPNGACPPGAKVNGCTICDFQCTHQQEPSFLGNALLVCCGNTQFNGTVPSCQGTSMQGSTNPSIRPVPATSPAGVPEKSSSSQQPRTSPIPTSTSSTLDTDRPTSNTPVGRGKSGVSRLIYLSIPAGITLFSVIVIVVFFGKKIFPRSKRDPSIIERGRERDEEVPVVLPDNGGYYLYNYVREATPTEKQLVPSENYDMGALDKGLVFIINNHSTSKDTKIKDGSEIDVRNIEHVFRQIGYDSLVETGLTADGIKSSLDRLKTRITGKHTSVIVVVMAHGDEHRILGVDDQAVSLNYIQDQFSAKNCPALEDKPKIFFYQCLRKKSTPRGATGMSPPQQLPQMKFDRADVKDGSTSPDILIGPSSTKSFLETDGFLIENADSFIVHVIMKAYRSSRNNVNGSYFIQILCEELLARSHRDNLDSIMTGVTRRVARIGNVQSPRVKKLGISKRIYFLPKYENRRSRMEDPNLQFRDSHFNDDDDTQLLPLN